MNVQAGFGRNLGDKSFSEIGLVTTRLSSRLAQNRPAGTSTSTQPSAGTMTSSSSDTGHVASIPYGLHSTSYKLYVIIDDALSI